MQPQSEEQQGKGEFSRGAYMVAAHVHCITEREGIKTSVWGFNAGPGLKCVRPPTVAEQALETTAAQGQKLSHYSSALIRRGK